MLGLSTEANEFESFVGQLDRSRLPSTVQAVGDESTMDFQTQKDSAVELVRKLNSAVAGSKNVTIISKRRRKSGPLQKTATSLLLVALACSQGFAGQDDVKLTNNQLESIFEQANESYRKASESAATDSAEAKVLFASAADQYQVVADQGIRNSELYILSLIHI